MGRALLFTGQPRVGKSTAIREVVSGVGLGGFTGFITGEDRPEGQRTGFSITMLDGRKGSLASVSSDSDIRVESITQGKHISYGVNLGFLETVALPAIRESVKESPFDVIIVDEIGPMQLNSVMFRGLILDLLDRSNATILGSVVARSFPWTDELKSRPDVETFLLTHQNRVTLTEMMTDYLFKRTRTSRAVQPAPPHTRHELHRD